MKSKNKFVSILIVNYNGKHLLEECIESITKIDYPKNDFEVIIVDNDSQDDSIIFIEKNYPWIHLIQSKENLGFAGGNNLALKNAKGEYIVLLNNDTVVDPQWLTALVESAQDNSVGIVTSKLFFHVPFIEIKITSTTDVKSNIYVDSQEYAPYGIIVDDISCSNPEKNSFIWYKSGFYDTVGGNYSSKWTDGHGVILLPFLDKNEESYHISLHGRPDTFNDQTKFEIRVANEIVVSDYLPSREVKQINLIVKKSKIKNKLIYLVQNAGNIIFKNGLGRDRGSVIKRTLKETKEFYDYDSKYYNTKSKVVSMCGASCLIKRDIIPNNTLFDPAYFMYYEDVDLSLKVWKSGYDIIYQPKSVVYHKHRASTNKQTSAFFISHIDKNHLFFLLTHFPLKIFIIQYIMFIIKLFVAYVVVFLLERLNYYGRIYKEYSVKLDGRTKAFNGIRKNLSRIYQIRKELEKTQKRGFTELIRELY